ncbi:unnamed protein product (mitochondrion) [Plasmodiophora brassicae]|uniref:Uncharacterized protein n=1 Tax=Plasmodiophora brassicae TaxID=37360 RepID=A0A3P3YAW8_PLABS|nr:unnamed protein product [Plasmodiophora brassicae]
MIYFTSHVDRVLWVGRSSSVSGQRSQLARHQAVVTGPTAWHGSQSSEHRSGGQFGGSWLQFVTHQAVVAVGLTAWHSPFAIDASEATITRPHSTSRYIRVYAYGRVQRPTLLAQSSSSWDSTPAVSATEPYTSSALHNYYFQTGKLLRLLGADGNDRVPHDIVDAQGNTALNRFINVFASGGYIFRAECFDEMLRDQERILDYLISGAKNFINIQNECGRAPLHSLISYWKDTATGCGMAAFDCSLETLCSIVSYMIRAGASTRLQDGNGDTALHLIAQAAAEWASLGSGNREDQEACKQMWIEKLIRPVVDANESVLRVGNDCLERPEDLLAGFPGLEDIRDALSPPRRTDFWCC